MAMIKLTVDDRPVEVSEGTTVLAAARSAGITIPTLCHHPKLTAFGGCRLCVVEVKGAGKLFTGCTTPVWEGMEVITQSDRLWGVRKTVIELLLSDHPNDCMTCQVAGSCTLQDLAYEYGCKVDRYAGERRVYDTRDANPFLERDMERCILCGRCVKVCDEVQGVSAIDFTYRGFHSKISPPYEHDLNCEFCGQCVAVCPTGALTGKRWAGKGRLKDVREVQTTCSYCGTGCALTLHVKNNEVIRASSPANSLNEGWLCVKGRFGYEFINSPDRLKRPMIRKNGQLEEVSWDEALDYTAKRLGEIKEKHGADAIGGLASARATNEDNYLFQKFIRAVIGTNNIDHCARL